MPQNRINRPIILGIVGDSAAGKTTLTKGVCKILGEDNVATFCMDDYHMYDRNERKQNGTNALDPEYNYLDILSQHLDALRNGKNILKPVYNHDSGTLDRPELIKPKPYIIAEGLFGFHTKALRDFFDVKIYLEPAPDLRLSWKTERDTEQRGYTEEQVLEELKKREFYSKSYIESQKRYADIVVNFYKLNANDNLSVKHIMRPTLPHPDLSKVLDADLGDALSLNLDRDENRKPVDILTIDGNISEPNGRKLESMIWDSMSEVAHLREVTKESMGKEFINHPLLVTQLILIYHAVKAAQGITAL